MESTEEGTYVEGIRSGRWITRYKDGNVYECTYDGASGLKNGPSVERNNRGIEIWKGFYVDGASQGHHVYRNSDGSLREEGPVVAGKRHGLWVGRDKHGNETKGHYVDDKKHGKWVEGIRHYKLDDVFDSRFVGEGEYVEGRKHGLWVYHHPSGDMLRVEFEGGNMIVPFFLYDHDGEKCWRMTHQKKKKVKKKNCLKSER